MYAIKAMQSLENTVASFIVSWDMRREHIKYIAIKFEKLSTRSKFGKCT